MPFSTGSMPPRLKDKGIPQNIANQWIEVWNSVYAKSHDEGAAYAQANGVLHKAMVKAGYKKGDDGVWHKGEDAPATQDNLTETWIPSGVSQNDLDDGDFAWLSNAYKAASADERKKMNKSDGRKLPYKIHGKVDREGWKAAWKAAAHSGARHPSFSGGPSQEAVLATLRRNKPTGITIAKDNTFMDGHGEDLIGFARTVTVLEETEKGMRVKGVALVDEAVSKNNRYYGARFNEKAMEATNQYMAQGNLVTLYSRHAKALPSDGAVRDLPVGQVVKPLFRDGREIAYEAVIAPTADGKDVMALLRTFGKLPTSIRSTRYESRIVQLNGVAVEEMLEAVISGIDFTDEPGIEGAGVREILEEAPKIEEVDQQEEEDMDMKDLTLAMLEEGRKDLLEQHATAVLEPLRAAIQEQATKTADLEGANKALSTKITDLEAALAAAGLQTKIAEASLIGNMEHTVYEELKQTVHEEADLAKAVPAARDKAFIAYAAGISSGEPQGGNAKGTSSAENLAEGGKAAATTEDEEPLVEDESLTEEFQHILTLAGATPRVKK